MPFGLCNAPATFERLMNRVMSGLQWETLLVYLDDVIVFGGSIPEEITRLRQVFQRLREAGLKLKPKKCNLFKTSVSYLGHVVSNEGVATEKDKTEAISEWPTPKTVKEVRSFLGLASYYRRFVEGFAQNSKPLHQLTEKGRRFEWNDECQYAFDTLKQRLTSPPLLAYPRPTEDYILDTDASNDGIGAVLSQIQDGQERVVAYASKVLSKAERNYCVTRRELLAVVVFLKHFRQYLYGRHVLVRTDHGALRWLINFRNPEGQLARWLEVISTYDVEIKHRAGRIHSNADALSRKPCRQCGRQEGCQSDEFTTSRLYTIQFAENRSNAGMRKAQREDLNIQAVFEAVETGQKPSQEKIHGLSFQAKVLLQHWDQLAIREGILCRKWESEDGQEVRWRIVLPKSERRKALFDLHSAPTAGHLGINKTLDKMRQRFYWVGMKADVRSFIRECPTCARFKPPPKRGRAPLQQRTTGSPMERIALDILGPLPTTDDGNKYVLVVADYYTKYVEAYAIPDEKADTVAQKLVDEFICRYGVPQEMHSDQGRNFESKLFQEVCRHLGIRKTRTTPWNPKSDGMVERFNRTLISMLSTLLDPHKHQRDWDRLLPYVTAAYRSTTHETTKETPNMMMFGREVRLPIDVCYTMPEEKSETDYAQQLRDRLETAYRRVTEQKGQKRNYDRKMAGESYTVEKYAWLRNSYRKKGLSPKFTSRWDGPFKIISKLSDVTYRIQLSPRSKCKVVHFDRLKPYEGPIYQKHGKRNSPMILTPQTLPQM